MESPKAKTAVMLLAAREVGRERRSVMMRGKRRRCNLLESIVRFCCVSLKFRTVFIYGRLCVYCIYIRIRIHVHLCVRVRRVCSVMDCVSKRTAGCLFRSGLRVKLYRISVNLQART